MRYYADAGFVDGTAAVNRSELGFSDLRSIGNTRLDVRISIRVVRAEISHGLLVPVHVEICAFAEIIVLGLSIPHYYYLIAYIIY